MSSRRNNSNARLVFASDGSHKNLCKKCSLNPCKCRRPVDVKPEETTLKIRVEKKGRGGKAVSVVFELPNNPGYFKDLCKKLKNHCGTGGTFKDGLIEIQGDQRNKMKEFLEKQGFTVKLAGG